jgi:nucleoside phosphorylase
MAHHGEAQGVIEKFQLVKIRPDLWRSEKMLLLLTGEGPFEAATRTAMELAAHPISEIINLGIAGTLSRGHAIGSFIPVRTVYLVQDLKPMFKTFQMNEAGEDCVTSFERILDPEKSEVLKGLGTLVDREAWGVAMAAKTAGIPMRCYKVISDDAGRLGACELVKEKADEFSAILADNLSIVLKHEMKTETEIELPGFYLTFSLKHKFQSLLQKLAIKQECSQEEVLKCLPLDELRALEVSPKEKAKRLLERMEDEIDPVKKVLSLKSKKLQDDFKSHGFEIRIDPTWENPKLSIVLEAADDSELKQSLEKLKTLSIQSFSEIMKGNFHVE